MFRITTVSLHLYSNSTATHIISVWSWYASGSIFSWFSRPPRPSLVALQQSVILGALQIARGSRVARGTNVTGISLEIKDLFI